MAEPEMKTVDLATGRIAYREAGPTDDRAADSAGPPPLVCLHGLGGGAMSWANQLAGMSRRRRVIAWDCPGYGGSADHAIPRPGPADYADTLVAMLNAIGVTEAFDLVGHSMGGVIAPQVVGRHPGRVRRLVLSATRIGFRDWGDYAERLRRHAELTPEEFGRTRAESMCAPHTSRAIKDTVAAIAGRIRGSGYAQAIHLLSVSDNRAEAAALGIPVLVLAGAEDRIVPEEATAALTAAIPGARREIVAQAAHAAYLERPEAYNARLCAFLQE